MTRWIDQVRWPAVALVLIGALAWASGCQTTQTTARSSADASPPREDGPVAPLDTQASAERLHEIAGSLLLYYVKHQKLPDKLTELTDDAALDCPPLVSPTSGQAYVYHHPPLPMRARPGALLIHEPAPYGPGSEAFDEPVHWAMLIDDRPGQTAPVTQVIFVAAREITEARRRAAPGD